MVFILRLRIPVCDGLDVMKLVFFSFSFWRGVSMELRSSWSVGWDKDEKEEREKGEGGKGKGGEERGKGGKVKGGEERRKKGVIKCQRMERK